MWTSPAILNIPVKACSSAARAAGTMVQNIMVQGRRIKSVRYHG